MADYQKMYSVLFQAVTETIALLQQAQRETEEMYISANESVLAILREPENVNNDEDENVSIF